MAAARTARAGIKLAKRRRADTLPGGKVCLMDKPSPTARARRVQTRGPQKTQMPVSMPETAVTGNRRSRPAISAWIKRDSPPGSDVREIRVQINVKNPNPVRSDSCEFL